MLAPHSRREARRGEAKLLQETLQSDPRSLAIRLDPYRSDMEIYLNVVTAQTAAPNNKSGVLSARNR